MFRNCTTYLGLSSTESGVPSRMRSSVSCDAMAFPLRSAGDVTAASGDDTPSLSSSSESNGFMSCFRVIRRLLLPLESVESRPGVSPRAGELRAESGEAAPGAPGDSASPDGGAGRCVFEDGSVVVGDLTVLALTAVGLVTDRLSLLGDLESLAYFTSRPYISDEIRAFWSVSNSPTV